MERTVRLRGGTVAPGDTSAEPQAGDIGRALRALSDADLVRLKALARLWSRGLPGGVTWTDILNEAILRALDGTRRWPQGVPLLAFLGGVMRSLCDDHWRRARRHVRWPAPTDDDDTPMDDRPDTAADPERVCAAAQALGAVHRLFADDAVALRIIAGLAEGLTAREICRVYGLAERDYDSARKRMRRALLRCGLSWSEP
jgi:RNA polymerase sigma-70 factor (ECF subfamily)